MQIVIQRVSEAEVCVAGTSIARIGRGLLLLVGVERADGAAALTRLAHKILHYRLFPDAAGKMNLNVAEAGGALLAVSQFTLAAETAKGLRPGFSKAAPPAEAEPTFDAFVDALRRGGVPVATGRFGADMQVKLVNDGPVTFVFSGC